MLIRCLTYGLVLMAVTGCNSIRTSVLHRLDNDSVVVQETNKNLRGLPVKLKVPSHIGVTIYEEQVLIASTKKDNSDTTATGYSLISFNPPQIKVDTELCYTDKVFLVDFKRPGGGVLDVTGAEFDNQQYFKDVQASVEEQTLADIGTALQTVQGLQINPVPNQNGETADPTDASTEEDDSANGVDFQKSVIAYKRFDISEPGWEDRMNCFIQQYLGSGDYIAGQPCHSGVCHVDSAEPRSLSKTAVTEHPKATMVVPEAPSPIRVREDFVR